MRSISVSGLLTGSDTDILNSTDLQSIPANGVVIVELQASANDGTNGFTSSLAMPGGQTPFNGLQVPAGVTAGAINADDKYIGTFRVTQGGHVTLSATEAGTATLAYRVTWKGS